MTKPESLIRWSTVAAVAAVAVVAGWVSYQHAYAVVIAHGEPRSVARLYPATIDGLIYAASMVLLDSARRKVDAPLMAWCLLGVGIAATLAANVLDGIGAGPLAAGIAAWPAMALVGSYEMLMLLVRGSARRDRSPDRSRTRPESTPESTREGATGPAHESTAPVLTRAPRERPGSATRDRSPRAPRERTPAAPVTVEDAEREFMTELAEGQVPSLRQIRARLHVGPDRAKILLGHLENVMART